jgi:argininosuccinate lyase
VRDVLTVHGALNSRTTLGGTSPASFAIQIQSLNAQVAEDSKKIADKSAAFQAMMGA